MHMDLINVNLFVTTLQHFYELRTLIHNTPSSSTWAWCTSIRIINMTQSKSVAQFMGKNIRCYQQTTSTLNN